ncbi:MAG TPA: hypothetical protein VM101_10640 [Flavitalea sp.]|nr:hypothetical protein [Flavitalea sp.]
MFTSKESVVNSNSVLVSVDFVLQQLRAISIINIITARFIKKIMRKLYDFVVITYLDYSYVSACQSPMQLLIFAIAQLSFLTNSNHPLSFI